MEQEHPSMHNVHVDVREKKEEIEFRYRIVEGKADKSYGINVARLAHLPKVVLDRAKQLLNEYETGMIQKDINQVYLSWIQCSLKNQNCCRDYNNWI